MAIFNKPEFNSVWATTGTKIDPGAAKIGIGWVVEIPPHEYANWLENRRDAMLAHLNQAGIPAWDSTAEYQANKSYVQGASTGVVYKCLITNTGVDPELDIQGNWEVAFQRSGEALLKSQNLADVPNKAQARDNLGIATTADYDARYLIKSQNLADVPNKSTARSNLGLGNSATLNTGTAANTVAAGNDSRIVNAVPNSRTITAGNGLVGGGNLNSNVTLTLGTPLHVSRTSGNTVTATGHSHALDLSGIFPTSVVDVTGSRSSGTTYTNNSSKFIQVSVTSAWSSGQSAVTVYINGVMLGVNGGDQDDGGGYSNMTFLVPPGATYRAVVSPGLSRWVEIV